MRFDLEGDECQFPEWEALASQLREDAAFLAGRYPSRLPRSAEPPSEIETALTQATEPVEEDGNRLEPEIERPEVIRVSEFDDRESSRWAIWKSRAGLSAAAILVAVAGFWSSQSWREGKGASASSRGPNSQQPEPATATVMNPTDSGLNPSGRDFLPNENGPAVLPAMSFEQLNSCQQEAVLDLLEDHKVVAISVGL